MVYNEKLADRVREIMAVSGKKIEEKRMFGGLCFMVDDKMCVGVRTDNMMVRIPPETFEEAAEESGFEPMIHNGRRMTGYGFVREDSLRSKKQLERWVGKALEYNQVAKSSKKK